MTVDRDDASKYADEYDVKVRRFKDILALTSARKEAMGAALSEFQPGETIREHVNKPNVEEIFFLLDGTADLRLDGEVIPVAAGDMAFARIGQSHAFTNTGTEKARLLSIWWKAPEPEGAQA